MITPVLFQKMPQVSSDKPQAENPIFPRKHRKPQADSHSCRACLLNCVLFTFCVLSAKIATLRVTEIIFSISSGGGGKAVLSLFFPPFLFCCSVTRGEHKRETNGSVSAVISWIAQWECGKSGCMQQIGIALKQQPCCEGDGFSLQQSDCKPRVCKWNRGRRDAAFRDSGPLLPHWECLPLWKKGSNG